jgi:uncharacterized protein
VEAVGHALLAGVETTLGFLWDSLFGLIFGFLISAIVQVVLSRKTMHRYLGPNLQGVLNGTGFGIIASACSYGAAAAARGFFQKGADLRAVFAFMISSTNMNIAILIMFWALLGWKFAFAEFVGGLIIIAVVTLGVSALFSPKELRGLAATMPRDPRPAVVEECVLCGMEGEREHAFEFEGSTFLLCGARHESVFRADPQAALGASEDEEDAAAPGLRALRRRSTWREILEVASGDVQMLRTELIIGFTVAGFAAALIPAAWLSNALHAVGGVPYVGYPLLLLVGLGIAVVTFVCSMGNVPIARFLAGAGIPLGANTTFIYGDLLIPPLLGIYRKSFPPKAVWAFIGLFIAGALLAGALMDLLIGNVFGGVHEGMAMDFSDRFTLVSNIVGLVALAAALVAGRQPAAAPKAA